MTHLLIQADARKIPLADKSVHAVVTSPPYWNLRDYLCNGQIGLEETPAEFVASMVAVFREVKRILRDDGCAWVNLGDSYAAGGMGGHNKSETFHGHNSRDGDRIPKKAPVGLKPKDLCMIPHRVAIALQDDGWYIRDAIVWAKGEVDEDNDLEGSPMPGSQRDRCTSAYEFMFQLAKSQRYYFDQEAIKTSSGAILRNVWRINPEPWKGAHFATFPRKLVEPCIKAGTSERGACPKCGAPWERATEAIGKEVSGHPRGNNAAYCAERTINGAAATKTIYRHLGWRPTCTHDAEPVPCVVFDPFNGSGTTGVVALALNRHYIGCDLSSDYLSQARRRIERPHQPLTKQREQAHPLFAHIEDA